MKLYRLFIVTILFACNQEVKLVETIEHINGSDFFIKDTISTIIISHKECTGCLDAFVDSGKVYIDKNMAEKIKNENIPINGLDLVLIHSKENIDRVLFGDSTNFLNMWDKKYRVWGKSIDTYNKERGYGIIFEVQQYQEIKN